MRNPVWQRDELILALDLYFNNTYNSLGPKHPKVVELSRILKMLSALDEGLRTSTFRNPQGVYMKLGNFLAIDPDDPRKGLPGHGKLDRAVFEEFAGRREELSEIAALIIRTISDEKLRKLLAPTLNEDNDEELTFREGRVLYRLHRIRERKKKLVDRKKSNVLKLTGRLNCEVCGFDFEVFYGRLGKGFAECHHVRPVSQMETEDVTKLGDLAIVCANCHRMLHRDMQLGLAGLQRTIGIKA